MNKHLKRKRRAQKTKAIQRLSNKPRLVVYKSACHIYAQIVQKGTLGDVVIVAASSKDTGLSNLSGTKSEKAFKVGKLLGDRAKEKELTAIAFDRSGYPYHGRIKALADGARDAGLNF